MILRILTYYCEDFIQNALSKLLALFDFNGFRMLEY